MKKAPAYEHSRVKFCGRKEDATNAPAGGRRANFNPSFYFQMTEPTTKKRKTDAPASEEAGYMPGFGNHFASEVLEGALPKGMNNPQKVRLLFCDLRLPACFSLVPIQFIR